MRIQFLGNILETLKDDFPVCCCWMEKWVVIFGSRMAQSNVVEAHFGFTDNFFEESGGGSGGDEGGPHLGVSRDV